MPNPMIGINGFGRIGRLILRSAIETNKVDVVVINDPHITLEYMVYVFTHDTAYGRFKGKVHAERDRLIITAQCNSTKTHSIVVRHIEAADNIPWAQLRADYVVESTGKNTEGSWALKAHIQRAGGTRKVIIAAPSDEITPMFVFGVNHPLYTASHPDVISVASSTTNCLAPLIKVVHERFGIIEGVATSVYSTTATHELVDGPNNGNKWYDCVGLMQNIKPMHNDHAKAVGKVIPALNHKLKGTAFYVPIRDVSVVDLTVQLDRAAELDEINAAVKEAAEGTMMNIMDYVDYPVMSSDFHCNPHSTIFDAHASISLNTNFCKLTAWFNNDYGNTRRIVDLIAYMHENN